MNDRDPVAVLVCLERRVVWTEVVQMWDLGTKRSGIAKIFFSRNKNNDNNNSDGPLTSHPTDRGKNPKKQF